MTVLSPCLSRHCIYSCTLVPLSLSWAHIWARLLDNERNTWTELRADPEMTLGPCIIDISPNRYITKVCGCLLHDLVVPKIADTQPHFKVLSPSLTSLHSHGLSFSPSQKPTAFSPLSQYDWVALPGMHPPHCFSQLLISRPLSLS